MSRIVEIDETELQKSTQLRAFVENIMRNPKAKRKLLEAQREVRPDDPMVKELDTPEPLEEIRASHAKEIADLRKEIADREAKREQDEKITAYKRMRDDGILSLRGKGYQDAGIKAIEEIMDKKGILDPLDAAAIFERDNPPAAPVTPNRYGGWNFADPAPDDSDDIKKLFETRGESNLLIDKMASNALADARGQPRR
jgi:hypothetical protein